jgi:hypothetical protein
VELKYRGVKVLRVESQTPPAARACPISPAGPASCRARRFFQTPTVFVYILVMLATGLVLDSVMLRLRRRLIPWDDETA